MEFEISWMLAAYLLLDSILYRFFYSLFLLSFPRLIIQIFFLSIFFLPTFKIEKKEEAVEVDLSWRYTSNEQVFSVSARGIKKVVFYICFRCGWHSGFFVASERQRKFPLMENVNW